VSLGVDRYRKSILNAQEFSLSFIPGIKAYL